MNVSSDLRLDREPRASASPECRAVCSTSPTGRRGRRRRAGRVRRDASRRAPLPSLPTSRGASSPWPSPSPRSRSFCVSSQLASRPGGPRLPAVAIGVAIVRVVGARADVRPRAVVVAPVGVLDGRIERRRHAVAGSATRHRADRGADDRAGRSGDRRADGHARNRAAGRTDALTNGVVFLARFAMSLSLSRSRCALARSWVY